MKDLNQCKKAFLLRYNAACKAQNEADDEMDTLLKIGSAIPVGDGMTKGTSDMSMPERFSIHAEKVIEDLRKAFERYEKTRAEVQTAIMGLEDESLIAIMRDRYINFKLTPYEAQHNEKADEGTHRRQPTQLRSWQEISERNGYSGDWTKHLHGVALEKIVVPEWWIRRWEDRHDKFLEEMAEQE